MSYRGSEWRKWDLHFHTPSSYDYKDKSQTNEQIIEKLIENGISVVAITDHHIIDVHRIKELDRLADGRITILPGIEFLSDAKGKDPIHFIAIFPENEKCKIDFIWKQIESKTAISKIEGAGKKLNEVYCDLLDTINLVKELGGIITIHAGDKTNSVENITHSLPHTEAQKTDIAHAIDIYELGKESDQDGYKKFVFPSINKVIPMIICSDNHDIKNYTLKQNCWIKADPTFEGLKQIIYEPERVKIQEEKPEIKTAYEVIKSIKIIDPQNIFTSEKIGFSSNLNSIIGGKSSGKSSLLFLLAKTVLSPEKFEEIKKYKNFVVYDNLEGIDCEVEWEDGQISKLSSSDNKRHIDYIPQMHLNNIAEDKEKNITFKQTIDKLLHEKLGYTNALHSLKSKILEKNQILSNEIDKYFDNEKELKRLESELSLLGDKKAIEATIIMFNAELQELKSKSNLTPEDELEIKKINDLILEEEKKKTTLNNDIVLFEGIKKVFENLNPRVNNCINEEFANVITTQENKILLDNIKINLSKQLISTIDSFKSANPLNTETLSTNILQINEKIDKLRLSLEPYNEKFNDKKKFLDTQKKLADEEEKLKKISQKV
jgi:hypothetical protein